ncbi:conjugal transfer protein [Clostridioides difficile]|nr:conjugal transfer protein [Clostridioides difficile]OJT74492.1 conjugal transfer protein [Clostridioides difficile]HDF2339555.1 conjugal transfer protein [Clostridioides difficile]
MRDIFKDMQAKVGCEDISDLPSYKRKVWQEMKRLNPAYYEKKQLEDFSDFVFGMSYQTLKDVMKQQKGREEQCRKQGCWWKRSERLTAKQRHAGSTCR